MSCSRRCGMSVRRLMMTRSRPCEQSGERLLRLAYTASQLAPAGLIERPPVRNWQDCGRKHHAPSRLWTLSSVNG